MSVTTPTGLFAPSTMYRRCRWFSTSLSRICRGPERNLGVLSPELAMLHCCTCAVAIKSNLNAVGIAVMALQVTIHTVSDSRCTCLHLSAGCSTTVPG